MIYVDTLANWGKIIHGHGPYWAHLGTDDLTPEGLEVLHAFAERLGLKCAWFQNKPTHPHFDLTANKHALALKLGAQQVTCQEFVRRCALVLWERAAGEKSC
jgi:uncharacterized protein DUF4031